MMWCERASGASAFTRAACLPTFFGRIGGFTTSINSKTEVGVNVPSTRFYEIAANNGLETDYRAAMYLNGFPICISASDYGFSDAALGENRQFIADFQFALSNLANYNCAYDIYVLAISDISFVFHSIVSKTFLKRARIKQIIFIIFIFAILNLTIVQHFGRQLKFGKEQVDNNKKSQFVFQPPSG